jgi:hypothetical protein
MSVEDTRGCVRSGTPLAVGCRRSIAEEPSNIVRMLRDIRGKLERFALGELLASDRQRHE